MIKNLIKKIFRRRKNTKSKDPFNKWICENVARILHVDANFVRASFDKRYVSFYDGGESWFDCSIFQIEKLSEFLGTREIDLHHEGGMWGYSKYTPGGLGSFSISCYNCNIEKLRKEYNDN